MPDDGKTVFVPRPATMPKPRSAPQLPVTGQAAESLTKRIDKLGRGPGGDTLAVGPAMVNELRERSGLTPPPAARPPEIIIEEGDVIDEGDVISDSSAMLTPPPINETRPRKGRTKIVKQDFMTDPPAGPRHTPPPAASGGETRIE
jgi:hypothetical protein